MVVCFIIPVSGAKYPKPPLRGFSMIKQTAFQAGLNAKYPESPLYGDPGYFFMVLCSENILTALSEPTSDNRPLFS